MFMISHKETGYDVKFKSCMMGYKVLLVPIIKSSNINPIPVGYVQGKSDDYYGWWAQPFCDTQHVVKGFKTRRLAAEYLLYRSGIWPWGSKEELERLQNG